MIKTLVTGSNGQLGTALKSVLPDAVFTDIAELDITDLNVVRRFVDNHKIEAVINCAAYTAVDKAEDEPLLAQKINVLGPQNLARTGCKMIHISTDYVFDGLGHKPYQPEDATQPLNVYGQTKRAGEQAVLEAANVAAVIRTAWLYSPYGNNFVKTMRRFGAERSELNVVSDQVGTPTYAGDLAKAIAAVLPQLNETNAGIYHFTNEGVCSWYDFAVEIMSRSQLPCKVNPISSSAYPTKAARPFYGVLDKTQIKKTFSIEIRHWKEGLESCLKQF